MTEKDRKEFRDKKAKELETALQSDVASQNIRLEFMPNIKKSAMIFIVPTVDTIKKVLKNSKATAQVKFNALLFLKDAMDSRNKELSTYVSEKVLDRLKEITKLSKKPNDRDKFFAKGSDKQSINSFFELLIECLYEWSYLFQIEPKTQNEPSKYKKVWSSLLEFGIRRADQNKYFPNRAASKSPQPKSQSPSPQPQKVQQQQKQKQKNQEDQTNLPPQTMIQKGAQLQISCEKYLALMLEVFKEPENIDMMKEVGQDLSHFVRQISDDLIAEILLEGKEQSDILVEDLFLLKQTSSDLINDINNVIRKKATFNTLKNVQTQKIQNALKELKYNRDSKKEEEQKQKEEQQQQQQKQEEMRKQIQEEEHRRQQEEEALRRYQEQEFIKQQQIKRQEEEQRKQEEQMRENQLRQQEEAQRQRQQSEQFNQQNSQEDQIQKGSQVRQQTDPDQFGFNQQHQGQSQTFDQFGNTQQQQGFDQFNQFGGQNFDQFQTTQNQFNEPNFDNFQSQPPSNFNFQEPPAQEFGNWNDLAKSGGTSKKPGQSQDFGNWNDQPKQSDIDNQSQSNQASQKSGMKPFGNIFDIQEADQNQAKSMVTSNLSQMNIDKSPANMNFNFDNSFDFNLQSQKNIQEKKVDKSQESLESQNVPSVGQQENVNDPQVNDLFNQFKKKSTSKIVQQPEDQDQFPTKDTQDFNFQKKNHQNQDQEYNQWEFNQNHPQEQQNSEFYKPQNEQQHQHYQHNFQKENNFQYPEKENQNYNQGNQQFDNNFADAHQKQNQKYKREENNEETNNFQFPQTNFQPQFQPQVNESPQKGRLSQDNLQNLFNQKVSVIDKQISIGIQTDEDDYPSQNQVQIMKIDPKQELAHQQEKQELLKTIQSLHEKIDSLDIKLNQSQKEKNDLQKQNEFITKQQKSLMNSYQNNAQKLEQTSDYSKKLIKQLKTQQGQMNELQKENQQYSEELTKLIQLYSDLKIVEENNRNKLRNLKKALGQLMQFEYHQPTHQCPIANYLKELNKDKIEQFEDKLPELKSDRKEVQQNKILLELEQNLYKNIIRNVDQPYCCQLDDWKYACLNQRAILYEDQYWQLGVVTRMVQNELIVGLHFNNKSKFPIKMNYDGAVQFQQNHKKSITCMYHELEDPKLVQFELNNKQYRILLPTIAFKYLQFELIDQATFKHVWNMVKEGGIKQRLDLVRVNGRIAKDMNSLQKYFNDLIQISPSKYVQEYGLYCKLNQLYDMSIKLKQRQSCISLTIMSNRILEQKAYEIIQNLALILI